MRKFGVYDDDRPVFDWLRRGVPPPVGGAPRRSLEAQVMDWADDVAYSVHDVEDGIISGYVRLAVPLKDADERAALCRDAAEAYSPLSPDELGEVLTDLLADPALVAVAGFDGSFSALATLKNAASLLIGRFATAAVRATRERYGRGPLRRYDADLIVPRTVRAQVALLKGIALRYVMRRPGSEGRYVREREVLAELVAALVDRAPDALDPVFSPMFVRAADDAARLRVIIDQVASLTDQAALTWHARLTA
jgi:dGTPase